MNAPSPNMRTCQARVQSRLQSFMTSDVKTMTDADFEMHLTLKTSHENDNERSKVNAKESDKDNRCNIVLTVTEPEHFGNERNETVFPIVADVKRVAAPLLTEDVRHNHESLPYHESLPNLDSNLHKLQTYDGNWLGSSEKGRKKSAFLFFLEDEIEDENMKNYTSTLENSVNNGICYEKGDDIDRKKTVLEVMERIDES